MNAAQVKILKQFFHQFAELASETLTAFVEVESKEKQVSIATNLNRVAQPEKILLNKKEIAARLGVSARTVSELQTEGMPTVHLGKRRIQFNYEEVLIWLKGRKIKGRGKTKLRAVS
jgi:predicted DNA-binding transcriptional regulator AlpA